MGFYTVRIDLRMEVRKFSIKFDIFLKTFKSELGFRYFTQYYDSSLMKIILNYHWKLKNNTKMSVNSKWFFKITAHLNLNQTNI